MNRLKKNMTVMIAAFVLMFASLIGYTTYNSVVHGAQWFASPYNTRIRHQKEKIIPGDIYDSQGLVMATSDSTGARTYPQSEAARIANAHVLGDAYGITYGGAEAMWAKYIYGFNQNMVNRIFQAYKAEKNKGNDIYLTIDSDLNKYIYEQMGKNTGAVVVMNYQTGEVVASVSKNAFDIANVQELAKQEQKEGDTKFLNKATSGRYPPGSTFKIISAVSALENIPDAVNLQFDSPGTVQINGENINNYNKKGNGTIDLKKAVEVSSNTYFAQLAKKLGKSKLMKTAEAFGFNDDFNFSDLILYSSKYDPTSGDNALAWSAIGQEKDLVTPMHMCMIAGAIANDGVMMEPKTLRDVKNSLGMSIYWFSSKKYKTATTPEIARQMQAMMENAVQNGTGKAANVSGLTIGGKTGSAETGETTHAWFAGYLKDDSKPYAVSVILEGAGTGGSQATPLAKKIFTRLSESK